jgi:restriction system protein
MPNIWGIHTDQPSLDLVSGEFVSIGWDKIGNLAEIGPDRTELKERIAFAYPEAKPGAIPVWAGVLFRFAFEMVEGDYVISPTKFDSTLKFGRVIGPYFWDSNADFHRHRRPIEWLSVGVPRAQFSKTARYEIGSAVTMFKVKVHAAEFLKAIEGDASAFVPLSETPSDEQATDIAEDEPNAERIEIYTKDFVIDVLHKQLDPYQFEAFVAALLRAMGYKAEVTQASGDGGVDVIAFRDPLGLEPPIIKVQCKRTLGTIGGPDVQKLAGALAHGGSEVGLFVTLGSYSTDAIHIERTRQDLRLINGNALVSLVFEHYEHLLPEWKRLLPMRRIYVVDKEPDST